MVVRKAFLGISVTEWVAIMTMLSIGLGAYATISNRQTTTETEQASIKTDVENIKRQQSEQTTINRSFSSCISELNGNLKEINGKLDILIKK